MSFDFSSAQYYLVYDANLASLSMIPLPLYFRKIGVPCDPLHTRCDVDVDDGCALVLFAKNYEYNREGSVSRWAWDGPIHRTRWPPRTDSPRCLARDEREGAAAASSLQGTAIFSLQAGARRLSAAVGLLLVFFAAIATAAVFGFQLTRYINKEAKTAASPKKSPESTSNISPAAQVDLKDHRWFQGRRRGEKLANEVGHVGRGLVNPPRTTPIVRSVYFDALFVWSPSISSPPPQAAEEPWQFREPRFPEGIPASFRHHVRFTSGGHAFWADLTNGVLCCRCSDLLSVFGDDVEFRFIDLPPGYEWSINPDFVHPEIFRTMGCGSGDSIKFISISTHDSVPENADQTVTEGTLDTAATWQWIKGEELRVGDLWELEDFKKAGLPESLPVNPMLSTEGDVDDGGDLHFIVTTPTEEWEDIAGHPHMCRCDMTVVHHTCRFDMRSKRLVSSVRLSCAPEVVLAPRLLGCGFFRYLDSGHVYPVDNENLAADLL
uniref:DUF1618 domain-containing protein n=1 Tax=Leersia perrieri TaxID=77586 RepID=A0A0D9VZ46_9ORYZ